MIKQHYEAMVTDPESTELEVLILGAANLETIQAAYEDLPLVVPDWIPEIKDQIKAEIAHRSRAMLKLALRQAKVARADARSAEERRKDLDVKIADLESKLSNL